MDPHHLPHSPPSSCCCRHYHNHPFDSVSFFLSLSRTELHMRMKRKKKRERRKKTGQSLSFHFNSIISNDFIHFVFFSTFTFSLSRPNHITHFSFVFSGISPFSAFTYTSELSHFFGRFIFDSSFLWLVLFYLIRVLGFFFFVFVFPFFRVFDKKWTIKRKKTEITWEKNRCSLRSRFVLSKLPFNESTVLWINFQFSFFFLQFSVAKSWNSFIFFSLSHSLFVVSISDHSRWKSLNTVTNKRRRWRKKQHTCTKWEKRFKWNEKLKSK